jgi:hypothetical protein
MTETPDPLTAIERAVTAAGGKDKFLAYVAEHWPRLVGASIADVLEHTTSYDLFLDQTEPFYEAHGGEMPPASPNTAALHALIILGGELSTDRLRRLLADAGLIPAPALHWRRVVIGRAARGYSADGAELHYLVFLSPDGQYRLTRYPRNGQHTEDIMSAAASAVVVADPEEGRRLAGLFEAGESIPEIGWFPGAAPVPDRAEYTLLVGPGPGEPTPVAELPAIWRRAAARMGSAVAAALEGCAMVLERALAAEAGRWPGEDPRS